MNSKPADDQDLLGKLQLVQEENRQLRSELASLSKKSGLVQSGSGYNSETSNQELELIYQVMNFSNFSWWKMELPSGSFKFGHKKTDMLGYDATCFSHYEDFTKLLHPDDFKPAMQAMQDHLKGLKEYYHIEYRIKDINGEYLWFEDLGKVVEKDAQAQRFSLIGYVIDITTRKQAELALRKQTKDLENYLHIVPDLLARCKSNGFINLRTKAWMEHLGYDEDEEINLFSIIHPEEEDRLRSLIGDLQPEHSIKGIINRVFKKDGNTVIIEWHIKRLENEFLLAARDITERFQTELNLKESNRRFDQIATLNGEIIWETDTNGLYTYINQACEQVLGFKPEEIIGKLHFYDLMHPSGRDEMKKNAIEMMSKKEPFLKLEKNLLYK
jgi:PAS domain S-box-containing protein